MAWASIWKVFLIGSLAAFSVMAVLVTIGGASDIRKMIRNLADKDE